MPVGACPVDPVDGPASMAGGRSAPGRVPKGSNRSAAIVLLNFARAVRTMASCVPDGWGGMPAFTRLPQAAGGRTAVVCTQEDFFCET